MIDSGGFSIPELTDSEVEDTDSLIKFVVFTNTVEDNFCKIIVELIRLVVGLDESVLDPICSVVVDASSSFFSSFTETLVDSGVLVSVINCVVVGSIVDDSVLVSILCVVAGSSVVVVVDASISIALLLLLLLLDSNNSVVESEVLDSDVDSIVDEEEDDDEASFIDSVFRSISTSAVINALESVVDSAVEEDDSDATSVEDTASTWAVVDETESELAELDSVELDVSAISSIVVVDSLEEADSDTDEVTGRLTVVVGGIDSVVESAESVVDSDVDSSTIWVVAGDGSVEEDSSSIEIVLELSELECVDSVVESDSASSTFSWVVESVEEDSGMLCVVDDASGGLVSGDSAIACVEDVGSMLRVVLEMMPGVVLDSTMGAVLDESSTISSASIYSK